MVVVHGQELRVELLHVLKCMCVLVRWIELKKHLQCETLLGLARESTKKRRNKKFGECITTIRCVFTCTAEVIPYQEHWALL